MKKIIFGAFVIFAGYIIFKWYQVQQSGTMAANAAPISQLLSFWAPQNQAQAVASSINANNAVATANAISNATPGTSGGGTPAPQVSISLPTFALPALPTGFNASLDYGS